MASGKTIHLEDLPRELKEGSTPSEVNGSWQSMLAGWADQKLDNGEADILQDAMPQFEKVLIESAMKKTGGRRQRAAKLLGWGRNTLTRKIQELRMYEYSNKTLGGQQD